MYDYWISRAVLFVLAGSHGSWAEGMGFRVRMRRDGHMALAGPDAKGNVLGETHLHLCTLFQMNAVDEAHAAGV